MIPLGLLSATGAGITAIPTKILLTLELATQYNYGGIYGTPTVSETTVFPNTSSNAVVTSPNEILYVKLTATITTGLDEEYYLNPVIGQSIYFNIGGSIIGDSSLGGASSQTMYTDSNGQISKTFTGEEWTTFYNGDNIQAIFDGNIEGTFALSESGIMTITQESS